MNLIRWNNLKGTRKAILGNKLINCNNTLIITFFWYGVFYVRPNKKIVKCHCIVPKGKRRRHEGVDIILKATFGLMLKTDWSWSSPVSTVVLISACHHSGAVQATRQICIMSTFFVCQGSWCGELRLWICSFVSNESLI